MALGPKDIKEVLGWATTFSQVIKKVKEGSETEGSAITLNQEECKALVVGLKVAFKAGGTP